jgi:TldD protein
MVLTRRSFLQQTSAAVTVGLLTTPALKELWAVPPQELFSEPEDAVLMELALKAVEAARSAGASFADVRLAVGRELQILCFSSRGRPDLNPPAIISETGYGIRAIVDGAWGFSSGFELTADGVTEAAREAVACARSNRPRARRVLQLAPAAPVVQGRWATPIGQDPFIVPIREQAELVLTATAAALRVPGTESVQLPIIWDRLRQVFASTEGSLIVQHLDEARPRGSVSARAPNRLLGTASGRASLDGMLEGGYGYEALSSARLVSEMVAAAERAVAAAKAATPARSVDVGRYDLVFSADTVADLLNATLLRAVQLDRALGYEANAEGTTFAAPPTEVLGRYQTASKLLTLRADRSQPHAFATVKWDDEGVEPEAYTFIQNGVIIDYHTNRETAPHLAEWQQRQGRSIRSHGCVRGVGQGLPAIQIPNITMQPAKEAVSLDDLLADVRRGLYVQSVGGGTDQQLASGQFRAAEVREIVRGRLGGRIKDMAFQFTTQSFWNSLDAIGGPATASPVAGGAGRGYLEGNFTHMTRSTNTCTTVPARVRQVNVLNTGRTG